MKTYKWSHAERTVEVLPGSHASHFLRSLGGSPRMEGLGDAAHAILTDLYGMAPKTTEWTGLHRLLLGEPWNGYTRNITITGDEISIWRAGLYARASVEAIA